MPTVTDFTALTEGDWRWNDAAALGAPVIVTYALLETAQLPSQTENQPISGAYSDSYQALDAVRQAAVRLAIAEFEATTNLRFIEVEDSENANLLIHGNLSQNGYSWAYFPTASQGSTGQSYVTLTEEPGFVDDADWAVSADPRYGGAMFNLALHELGHAMGLEHPHEGVILDPSLDSHDNTIMSYNWRFFGPDSLPYAQLRPLDVDALEYLYGVPNWNSLGWSYAWDEAADFFTLTGSSAGEALIGVRADQRLDGKGGNDLLSGNLFADLLIGGYGADTLVGGAGNDTLQGDGGADSLTAGNGDDRLDGGYGADTLNGGDGADVYVVNSALDVIEEYYGGDDNEVHASISFDLSTVTSHIRILELTGSGAINGTGGYHANKITGNSGRNVLDGSWGEDTLFGMGGNDTLIGGSGSGTADTLVGGGGADVYMWQSGDVIIEHQNQGRDRVETSTSVVLNDLSAHVEDLLLLGSSGLSGGGNGRDNTLTGNSAGNALSGRSGNDTLIGKGGNDTLDGGVGADRMEGGFAHDLYRVNDTGDVVIEAQYQGNDTIEATVDVFMHTDSLHVEALTLLGSANLDGGGNGRNNVITGNAGNNHLTGRSGNDTLIGAGGNDTLNGGVGADSMEGGAGNDLYYVNDAGDVIADTSGTQDHIHSTLDFSLQTDVSGIEHLTLTGGRDLSGTGTGGANALTGNSGDNTLTGGAGDDTLTGGGGDDWLTGGGDHDRFVFADGFGADTVTDFADHDAEQIDFSAVAAITSFYDMINNHLSEVGGNAVIFDGSNTVTLVGVSEAQVGYGQDVNQNDFIF